MAPELGINGNVGAGQRVGTREPVSGVGCYVKDVAAVLALMEQDVSGLVLIVDEAGATGVAPILPDALGVICTSGGPTSHLALVAKEYGVACIMAAKMQCSPEAFDGLLVTMLADGSIEAKAG